MILRIPDDKLGWKPHEKSMTAGKLASHIAEMYSWGDATIKVDELDLAQVGGTKWEAFDGKSVAEIVARLDANFASVKEALTAATDDSAWMNMWTLKSAGQTLMSMPRVACLRGMVMNHIVHHRGQLSVYLRLMDVSVPAIYGPSADEKS